MSLHADARAVLGGWAAPDPEQDELRTSYLAYLDSHEDAMWRSCVPGHLTASTAVLSFDASRVALVLHRIHRFWLQTGGHCEPEDTTLRAAALREATEETGIGGVRVLPAPVRLDRHAVPCGGGSHHLDVQFAAVAPPEAMLVHDPEESADLGWFPVDTLPEPTDDSVRALVEAAVRAVVGTRGVGPDGFRDPRG